jgi:hypothetical protein
MDQDNLLAGVKDASLDEKKEIVNGALDVASSNGKGEELISDLLDGASSDIRKAAVVNTVSSSDHQGAKELLNEAVSAAPIDAARDAIARAVRTADKEDAQEIITQAINAAPAGTAKAAVEDAKISPETLDQIWLWIVKTFSFVLGGAAIGLVAIIVLDVFFTVEQSEVQIMLTVLTTVAGILAGFITGQAVGTAQERKKEGG